MNRLSTESLGGTTPIEAAFNYKPDTSPLLGFHWWQPVYYDDLRSPSSTFPKTSREKSGRWVGVAETKGNVMTYYVLDDETRMVLTRSGVRPITEQDPNLRTFPHGGEDDDFKFQDVGTTLKSSADIRDDMVYPRDKLPSFHPDDLIGASYLHTETDEEGLILRATIVNKITEKDALGREKALKFLVQYGDENAVTSRCINSEFTFQGTSKQTC
jgi:hypothetical protein